MGFLFSIFFFLLCHLAPIFTQYTTVCLLLKSSPLKTLMPGSSLPHLLLSLVSIWLSYSLCSSLLTCSLFTCSCRLWSLLYTSSSLSWDSTRGALMPLSSSCFVTASLSQELSFSSATPLMAVCSSSADEKTVWLFRTFFPQPLFQTTTIKLAEIKMVHECMKVFYKELIEIE